MSIDQKAPPLPKTTAKARRQSRRIGRIPRLISLPFLIIIGFLILVPVGFIVLAALSSDVPRPGNVNWDLTFENLKIVAHEGVVGAAINSLVIALLSTILALAIGGFLAFVCARTNIRFKAIVYLIGMAPIFLPSYVGALAWSILGSPAGLMATALRDIGVPIPVDIYSIGGVVLVMAMYYAPYGFLLIHGSMSLMNPELEDAAGVHGSSLSKTIRTVTIPLALPAILGSAVLIFIHVFDNFPVAQVLASPGQIDTLPTFIYRLINTTPSRGNDAAVISILMVLVVVIITLIQRQILAKRSYTTVSGKGMRARTIHLGKFRTPALLLAVLYFVMSIVLPLVALLLSAIRKSPYMRSFGGLAHPGAVDFSAFGDVLTSQFFAEATINSVLVAVGAAAIGTALAFGAGYIVYRTKAYGRGALESLSMLPLAIPAVVMGVGLLWTWLVMPLPIYGTLWVLIIGFMVVQFPQGFRGIASAIQSTDHDLEDSAILSGARRFKAITFVTLPLLRVSVSSTFLLLLMLSMREITVPLFLYTTNTPILSIAIYDSFEAGGALREASAMALVYCFIVFILSFVPRVLNARSLKPTL